MKRRGRTSGPSRKAVLPKARKTRPARRSTAQVQEQLDRALRERDDALDQQTATAEILQTINESPGDLTPVFDTMVESAMRLCQADYGHVYSYDGKLLHLVAAHGDPRYVNWIKESGPRAPEGSLTFTRILGGEPLVHLADISKDVSYRTGNERAKTIVDQFGIHTLLTVPLRKEETFLGGFVLYRLEAKPFSDKQISLVQNFAAQAVIAMENARLLNELRESLQQQTATADVLKAIAGSGGELALVFETMLENAVRICEASYGNMWLCEGEDFRTAALHGPLPPTFVEKWRSGTLFSPGPEVPSVRAAKTRQPVQVADLRADQAYLDGDPLAVSGVEEAGMRTTVAVPMLKENRTVGVIVIYRKEVRAFSDKQIELLSNFAAQAVIAIENTRLLNELRQRTDDLSESLEQQTATSEVLKVISSSPGELKPVFDALLANAVRICDAKFGVLFLTEGDAFRYVALHGAPPAFAEARRREPVTHVKPGTTIGRVAATKKPAQTVDIRAEPAYTSDPERIPILELAGARTILGVPMLKESQLVGAIVIYRQEVRPFTDKQIDLLSNFAAQAVIAIENTRLLNELHQRTDDLSESLEQQTATSEVLKVISSSSGELEPIFKAMLENAVRICGAQFANLALYDGSKMRMAALHNAPRAFEELRRSDPVIPLDRSVLGIIVQTKKVAQISDMTAEEPYASWALVKLAGARAVLAVPMLREGELVGAIVIYRTEPTAFNEKQIELLTNFASQAVIAIENARLLNELRESLQQQTATADVLKVISRSTFALQTVLDTLTESAARLCEADIANIWLPGDPGFRLAASYQTVESNQAEYLSKISLGPSRGSCVGRTLLEGRTVHIHDIRDDPEYELETSKLEGYRTMLGVPLLREGTPVGVIALVRSVRRPFTPQQIELVNTFADQAVIAIENTRLLNELRELLQQQTATADVLKVISRSAFHLQSVLDTLLNSAARLCQADHSFIFLREGDVYRCAAGSGEIPEWIDYLKQQTIRPGRGTIAARTALEGHTVHIPDVLADPEYTFLEAQKRGGYRTALGVPLLREGVSIGVIVLTRPTVRPFDTGHIALVTTFADQAVIAIENVRLFESVEARTRELAASFEELRTTQDRLVQTQKLALLGQLTAGIAHEIKNPLNFVNNFSGISAELIDELRDALKGVPLDDKTRTEINELADTLKGNFDKVVHHGRRADAIVKNMLQHSREGSGEHRVIDINALVEESLNLAWHGARAETQGFEVKLKQSFDPSAGGADVFPQDIRRALLNLIANGFYAANRRRAETNGGDYEPTLTASTKNLGDRVEVRIRDNGTGMTPDVKEKMFNPFFTTKPTGEGTGLGLSISHDVIVKQHAGTIEVDTQPGEFTEIRIVLPRTPTFV